jgi:hypothetical protein
MELRVTPARFPLPISAVASEDRLAVLVTAIERRCLYGDDGVRPKELQQDLTCSSRTLYRYLNLGLRRGLIQRCARNGRDVRYFAASPSKGERRAEWITADRALWVGRHEYERSGLPTALIEPLDRFGRSFVEPTRRRRGRPRKIESHLVSPSAPLSEGSWAAAVGRVVTPT